MFKKYVDPSLIFHKYSSAGIQKDPTHTIDGKIFLEKKEITC